MQQIWPFDLCEFMLNITFTGTNDKATQLETLLKEKGNDNVKIKYIPYDWGHNNKDD